MKKYQVLVLALVIGLVPVSSAFSQVGLGAVTWQISGGLGDTADFIDDVSLLGFGLEGRSYLAKHWTVGLEFDWQVWDQQVTEPIEIEGGTISGKQFRYINAFPILATFHLYAGDIHDFRMYLGAGVGAYYVMRRLQIGMANIEDNDWHFGGGPEFGFIIPMGESSLIAAGRLNYAVRNFDDTDDASIWWTAKLGIAYDRW